MAKTWATLSRRSSYVSYVAYLLILQAASISAVAYEDIAADSFDRLVFKKHAAASSFVKFYAPCEQQPRHGLDLCIAYAVTLVNAHL